MTALNKIRTKLILAADNPQTGDIWVGENIARDLTRDLQNIGNLKNIPGKNESLPEKENLEKAEQSRLFFEYIRLQIRKQTKNINES